MNPHPRYVRRFPEASGSDCDADLRGIGFMPLDNSRVPGTLSCMSLGTKNRQQQSAEICKQHLREKNPDNLGLVNEFIVEIEGIGKDHQVSNWGRFADASWKNDEMLKRVDAEFERWLNP